MKFDVLTLFPEMFEPLKHSIIERASKQNLININLINIRDFSKDKHKKVDDTPYGGGAGMVMRADVVYDAYKSVKDENAKVIYLTPQGKVLNQKKVEELSKQEHLILLCGDYVLTGGELPAMVLIDSVSRYVEGVLSTDSTKEESFSQGYLEYSQYTRPEEFHGKKVPEILASGNHQKIDEWRRKSSLTNTFLKRPELLNEKDLKEAEKIISEEHEN